MKKYIQSLIECNNLSRQEAKEAMTMIMTGEASDAQIASFMTALRMKGETVDEIVGCVTAMQMQAAQLVHKGEVMDLVGTGGDGHHTFNISTASSFIVASGGVQVAKHGNRSVSSLCGSADVLQALGVKMDLMPKDNETILEKVGMCFMFAPIYHPAMRYAAPSRKALSIRSIFNLLGPLSNPAKPEYMLLGVYNQKWLRPLSEVLCQLGVKNAMVVCGANGMDEVSLVGKTYGCILNNQTIKEVILEPEDYGLTPCSLNDLKGKDVQENANIIKGIFTGRGSKPQIESLLLNAGCCFYITSQTKTIKEGIVYAKELLDKGLPLKKLEALKKETQLKGALDVS